MAGETSRRMRGAKLSAVGLAAISATLLAACGSSGDGLIPAEHAGPLRGDFEAVARAVQSAEGNCNATERALQRTQRDLSSLPGSVNHKLRQRLATGVENLTTRALAECAQPAESAPTLTLSTTSSSSSTTSSTTTSTTTTTSSSTSTSTSEPTLSSSSTSTAPEGEGTEGSGGGVEAPNGESSEEEEGGEHEPEAGTARRPSAGAARAPSTNGASRSGA